MFGPTFVWGCCAEPRSKFPTKYFGISKLMPTAVGPRSRGDDIARDLRLLARTYLVIILTSRSVMKQNPFILYVLPLLILISGTTAILAIGSLQDDQRITLAISLISVVVTYVYVVFTYGILKANSEMLNAQVAMSREQTRPFVVVSFPSFDAAVHLHIQNVGNRPARNVEIRITPDLSGIKELVAWGDNRELTYSDRILNQPFMAPGAVVATVFGDSKRIINDLTDEQRRFTVSITYSDLESDQDVNERVPYSHTYAIDLGTYIHYGKVRQYTIEYHLGKVVGRLDLVNGSLKEIKRAVDELQPPPTHYEDGTPID